MIEEPPEGLPITFGGDEPRESGRAGGREGGRGKDVVRTEEEEGKRKRGREGRKKEREEEAKACH